MFFCFHGLLTRLRCMAHDAYHASSPRPPHVAASLPCYLPVLFDDQIMYTADAARRYQTSDGGPQFASLNSAQQIAYAQTTQTQQVAKLIKAGGVPPMFGEWAIAGAFCGQSWYFCIHRVTKQYVSPVIIDATDSPNAPQASRPTISCGLHASRLACHIAS